jgi:hypothetical protein
MNQVPQTDLRNGSEIKVQIDVPLLTLYFRCFDLNSWAIRAKKQKIQGQNLKPESVPLFQYRSLFLKPIRQKIKNSIFTINEKSLDFVFHVQWSCLFASPKKSCF